MNLLKDLFYVNKKASKRTLNLLFNNWAIIFTGLIYSGLMILASIILMIFSTNLILGFFTGILMFVIISAIISNYLYLLDNIIHHDKFTINDFKYGFKAYLRKIYTILFIGWVASLLYNMIFANILGRLLVGVISPSLLSFLGSILIFILLNSLPETIYQKHYQPVDTISYAFNFIKENWIEWGIPNIIFIALYYITSGDLFNNLFRLNLLNLAFNFDFNYKSIIVYILGQIIFSFMMIYRGVLFDILSTSTRRKRMFIRNMYK